jgi:DNA polymerase-3 subunit delta
MRHQHPRTFTKHLEASAPDHFASVYVFAAKEPLERRWGFEQLKKAVFKSCPQLDFQSFGGENNSFKAFLMALDMPPLLKSKRLLFFSDLHLLPKESLERLGAALEKLDPLTLVALTTESLAKQAPFQKIIEKQGVILELGEEKPWERQKHRVEWLMQAASELKLQAALEALELLAQGAPPHWIGLMSEWDKLITYTIGEQTITAEHVKRICCLTPQITPWALGEAILDLDFKKSMSQMAQLLWQGEAFIALLRQLRGQLTQSLHLLSLAGAGLGEKIEQKWPYLKGGLLQKQISAARKYGPQQLIRALEIIDKIEFKAKDSWDRPEIAAAYLIAALT